MTATYDHLAARLDTLLPVQLIGSVADTDGATITAIQFPAPFGSVCEIDRLGASPLVGEVIGFRGQAAIISPCGDVSGLSRGSKVRLTASNRTISLGRGLLGRVINAQGVALDGRGLAESSPIRGPLRRTAPPACERPPIDKLLPTGVRAVDALLTCGRGQRIGLFSGSGVGKSTLLGMMARYTAADINVIALVGERGREVNDFVQRDLGADALARSVVVVATSDEPALARMQAALAAMTIAEWFRDQGSDVLLMMDSLTRFAMAQRDLSLAAGEFTAARGYPPSVFAALPRLVERAGRAANGSITAFFTVLAEGDDLDEPISDAVRGLLDGHIVLSRDLAARGHWPAIDVLKSVSRLAPHLIDREHLAAITRLRELLAALRDHEDLISIGAYRAGSNSTVDEALEKGKRIKRLLAQAVDETASYDEARQALIELTDAAD